MKIPTNIPQGYKSSPLGIIPKDWEVKRLEEVCVNAGEYGLNAPAVDYNPALPTYLRITDIDVDGTFIKSDKKSVMADNALDYYLSDGDIVFARTGATVGKSYLYNPKDGRLVFAGFLIRFSPDKNKIVPYYIKCLTETIGYHNWVSTISTRSGQPGINAQEYASFQFPLPPLAEQERIAELLGTWDKAIEMQKQLIDKLELRKKGLMQQLFPANGDTTPQLRFPGFTEEWEEKKLGEVSDRITEKVGNMPLEPISVSANVGIISQKQRFGKDISGEQYKCYIHIKKGDYCYNRGNSKCFPQGCIYELRKFEAAAPNAFISFRFRNSVIPHFFNGYFDKNAHGKQLAQYITSGARSDGLLNLNAEDFFKIKFLVPSLSEQQKIADYLSSLDYEIQKMTEKRDKYIEEKQGLMQVLLTGKKRI